VDPQVDRDAAERIRLLAPEAGLLLEVADRGANRVRRRLHQVGPDPGADVVRRLLARRKGARREPRLRRVDLEVPTDREPHDDVHRRLDRGPADLAVALRRVRVAEREHGPAHRVDVVEVEPGHVLRARVGTDLLVGGIAHVQLDDGAVVDLERRLDRVVPDVVESVLANAVERARRVRHVEVLHQTAP
jgi:hypothetical protein